MAILNKVQVSLAPWKSKKFDLSCDHLQTHSFMEAVPVYYRHMVPGQSISVNAHQFTRLQPLSVPTYGRGRLNLRAFFCPFEFVQPSFNEFVTNSIYVQHNSIGQQATIPTSVHWITDGTLTALFTTNTFYAVQTPATGVADFVLSGVNYTFTHYGRRLKKLLNSLGYRWDWNGKGTIQFSMLPLLAYLRIYLDWYALSAYFDTYTYSNLSSFLKLDSPHQFTSGELNQIFNLVYVVCYDGDYFNSAWDNPTGPNSQTFTQFSIPDPTVAPGNGVDTLNNATPYVSSSALTEFQVQAVHALTDYYKRHQLVGARVVDRFLADFGVQLDSSKLRRSTFIGTSSHDIQIGDIMQTVNTATTGQPSNLGDFGGRGVSSGDGKFDYTAESHGIFIIVGSLLPSGGFYQGYDRNLRHIKALDHYNADFDNLGVQSIEKGEVYISNDSGFYGGVSTDGSFGYSPRYAEYKVPINLVTGDFDVPSVMAGGDSWHLMRKFNDNSFQGSPTNVHHSVNFARGDDGATYNRIFNYSSKEDPIDSFLTVYHFDVVSYAPMKSLFDTYDFDHDENHKNVVMETNGVKVN